ncbi:MAG: PaaI family thioesterase [Anaerovoracaceae bacterium]|nr:PaaI family thioesterase [Bacillota bacterium]MDY2670922.1 PaaI family thioesterase [Anaerovoracaceae bacterium]
MKYTHDEVKDLLIKYIERNDELNGKAGAEIFGIHFLDYDDKDVFKVKCDILDWQRNPFGNLQGGMICYYIDAVAGTLSWVSVDCEPVGTIDIDVNFIRAVTENIDYITVESKVISIGRRVVVAEARVFDPEGWLMATATVNTTRLLPPDPNPTIVEL